MNVRAFRFRYNDKKVDTDPISMMMYRIGARIAAPIMVGYVGNGAVTVYLGIWPYFRRTKAIMVNFTW